MLWQVTGSRDRFSPGHLDRIADSFPVAILHFRQRAQPLYVFSGAGLSALTMPSLLLCGEAAALFSAQHMVERAQRVLPALQEERMLPGMGHALGNCDEVARCIASFLDAPKPGVAH
jgi:pimeloyl-ACP methyl ester carboxylesterase